MLRMSEKSEGGLLPVSVRLGGSQISLVAWPELSVRGLAQRLLSNCGLYIDPEAVELHLGEYLLPQNSSLGTVVSKWHHPVALPSLATGAVYLKALIPSHSTGKARLKLDARGPPLHTVSQVAGRAVAAMALPAGPMRLRSAAADVVLLPYTFTNWKDAWDHNLMKVAVQLFRALLPDEPAAAGSVLRACSDLLDLPSAFSPRGQLYQGLCTLQLHIFLLQVTHELKEAGLASPPQDASAAAAGAAAAAPTSACWSSGRSPRGSAAACDGGARAARRASAGGGSRTSRAAAAAARQRDAAMDGLQQLLGKAAARVGVVLEQLSYYDSELSDMLASYMPSEADPVGPAPGAAAYGGGGGGAATAAAAAAGGSGPFPAASPPSGRDLRLQACEMLEPYAAMQLVEAFGRLAMGVRPACAAPSLLPPGTLPHGWDCHRSLFHAILDLAVSAGVRLSPPAAPEGHAHGHGHGDGAAAAQRDGLGQTHGSVSPPARGPTLELPVVANMLDSLLQLHGQAHSRCKGGPGAAAGAGRGTGGPGAEGHGDSSDDDSSDDGSSSSSDSSSGGARRRCCPRNPAVCQLPPCLDWLRDVVSVLGAACDVYALAGGSEAEAEEAEADAGVGAGAAVATEPQSAAAGRAAAAAGTSAGGGPLAVPVTAAATPVVTAAAAAMSANLAAAASVAPPAAARLSDPSGPDTAVAAAAAASGIPTGVPEQAAAGSEAQVLAGSGGGAAARAAAGPEPAAPGTPPADEAGGGGGAGAGGRGSVDQGLIRSYPPQHYYTSPDGSAADFEHAPPPPPKAPPSPAAARAADEDDDGADAPAPATPPHAAAAAAAGAAAAAAAPKGAAAAAAAAGPALATATAVAAAATAAAAAPPPALPSARSVVLDALLRAFQCPCLVGQALACGARSGELCERPVWRHPRLAGCAPAAAYQKQLLDELLTPLSYVYEDDDYDAPLIVVDRSDLLGTSMAALTDQANLHHEGICVSFEDEMAYGDGVLREWLTEISAALFDPNAGLFRLCEGDVRALHLCPAGCQQDNQLELLGVAGRVIGLAMRARVPLGFHLSTSLFKLLQHPGGAGRARLGPSDLAQLEPRLAATCGQIAAADDVEALGLTFVASCGQLGSVQEVPLLPGGRGEEQPVTAANRRDYLDRLTRFYCTWGCSSEHGEIMTRSGSGGGGGGGSGGRTGSESVAGAGTGAGAAGDEGGCEGGGGGGGGGWEECELDAVEALAQGLAESLFECDYEERVEALAARLRPLSVTAFNARLGGEVGRIDVAAWRSHTSAPAFKSDRERAALEAFWSVVSELSGEEQRRLLQFWTGISHLPAGGFKHLSQQLQIVPARALEDNGDDGDHGTDDNHAAGGSGGGGGGADGSATAEPLPGIVFDDVMLDTVAQLLADVNWGGGAGSGSGGSDGEQADADAGGGGGGGGSEERSVSAGALGAEASPSSGSSLVAGVSASVSASVSVTAAGGVVAVGGSSDASSSDAAADERAGGSLRSSSGSAGAGSSGSSGSSGTAAEAAVIAAGGGGGGGRASGPVLLAAHTCFFQLRLPLVECKEAMMGAVLESLANMGAFWNED
ncbi:hypothetical protein PLESTB_001207700 [Pleodorina starrii]|uniref:HECT-type E3 ubiquitin transferase n=1 Tax=Pleodorina starrii TaxID=330485 RepID=A0A9W6F676_9CHLO|nr:hypothetical protein PLESTM_001651600 [Pleodorina starrii]GLC57285.1 hypothetical protein PLESTB_001207700 [Pleodorina starrii]GLC71324.1 hypothetical protein PLESTF_001103100 [Pleodorina starrii]